MAKVSVIRKEGPEQLTPGDFRLAVPAELIAGDGEVLGKAVVLSPSIAVTTGRVANAARDRLAKSQSVSPPNSQVTLPPLGLMFAQFLKSRSLGPLSASLLAIDDDLRFGVLGFSGQLPMPVSSSMLGTGELPEDGAECSVVYADDPQKAFFQLSGQVENRPDDAGFYLYLRSLPADQSQLMGAPVFFESCLIGIVVSGPSRSVSGAFLVGVLSVRGMALSDATPAVRALLPWIPDEPEKRKLGVTQPKPAEHPSSPRTAQNATDAARSTASSAPRSEEGGSWLSAELFSQLSATTKEALERANGMRMAMGLKEVHMEQLIVGLYEKEDRPTKRLFTRAKLDAPMLLKIIREVRNTEIPTSYSVVSLTAFPPFSEHANKAMRLAVQRRAEQRTEWLRSRQLLYGALSVDECGLIKALQEHGIRKEDIYAVVKDDLSPQGRNAEESAAPAADSDDRRSPLPADVDGLADAQGGSALPAPNAESAAVSEEWWARMTPSARRVFERAMGMVEESRAVPGIETPADKKESNTLHMEFLIAALFESQKDSFLRAKIDRSELHRILRQAVGTTIPEDYRSRQLNALPETSEHVRHAIAEADKYARSQRARHIHESHLLHGAMLIPDCRVIGSLMDAGMRWQNLLTYTDPNDIEPVASSISKDQKVAEKPASAPPVGDLQVQTRIVGEDPAPTAAPTPKVDSDLWCERDKLGYEGYARTIAGLITHPETVPPLTIGIKAPWGAGKTSLMKRVQHLLDGRAGLSEENRSGARQQGQAPRMTLRDLLRELKEITKSDKATLKAENPLKLPSPSNVEGTRYGLPPRVTVWFNAWKYQTSEQIWAGMAHCIISQVTARMDVMQREMFWLRLHARRVNTDEVRRKVHKVLLRALVPAALIVMVACGMVLWAVAAMHLGMRLQWTIQGVTVVAGLIGVIWKARGTLGEKAAGTVKELVREPDYEGKMGYLHLVESDIREVLSLVTGAGASFTNAKDSEGAGAKALDSSGPDAALKGRSSTVAPVADPSTAKPTPLVVFVDDLDRCAPNKVAEVVEAINLFLCGDYPNCIFVLGMEPGMVAAALEVANKDVIAKAKEMGLVDGAAPVGWRFMEKIVQMPVMIPPPTKRGRDAYVESLVGAVASVGASAARTPAAVAVEASAPAKKEEPKKEEPPKEEEVRQFVEQMQGTNLAEVEKKSLEIVTAAAPEKRKAAAEAGKRVYAQTFSERDPIIADFVQECADLVDGNPRQIKRYVNVFRFYSTLRYGLRADGLAKAEELPSDKMLAKFVALSIQWPHAMDCLRGRHHVESDGRAVSRLEFLELKSLEMNEDDAGADEKWRDLVGEKGMRLESWAEARAFRAFLARGEILGKSGGHGLW